MRIVVLGAGLVGGPMAVDLSKDGRFDVTVADIRESALARFGTKNPEITTALQDLSNPDEVTAFVAGFDMVISSVPGSMGYATLQAAIRAGKDVVDIAFFAEDPFSLSELAEQKGVTAVVDCGVAPGMSNLLVGYADHQLDETETVLIYVGGLPEERVWPFEYKAGFSPADVIEEYMRPARYVENGALVVRPVLSDPEIINFPHVGSLEAFNTDGLRTLATTIDAPNKQEKTLRYIGHIEHVDLTVMRITVEGKKDDKNIRYTYELFDRHDELTGIHSMARTTGYTATVVARMLAEGLFAERGVIVPEYIGKDEACVDFVLRGLAERGVVYEEKIEELAS